MSTMLRGMNEQDFMLLEAKWVRGMFPNCSLFIQFIPGGP